MDANRYFEEMHRAMSAQKSDYSLILSVKVQDLGGADAYLELRRSASGHARVFYSTMGRQNFNFQLFRKGWQLCHNASGELTGRFPTKAEALLDTADFSACIRDDAFDAARTDFIVAQLRRLSDAFCPALPQSAREGAMITVDSFVGRGGHWCYWSTQAADCPSHCGHPLLAGRFSGRSGTPHPAELPTGHGAGRSVADAALLPLCPPGGRCSPSHFAPCPAPRCSFRPKPALAEHSGCAGDRITE